MRRFVPVLVLLALSLAVPVFAGGHATIKSAALPANLAAGRAFAVEFEVLHNGTTPMSDLKPGVSVKKGRRSYYVPATWSAEKRRYVAPMTLEDAGSWQLTIESNFCGNKLALAPVRIAPAAVSSRTRQI